MRRRSVLAVTLVGLASAVAGVTIAFRASTRAAEVGGPLPPVPPPPNLVPLDPTAQLGKYMIFDTTMSDPPGYACVQCHAYTAGFTSGLDPVVNLDAGVPPGVIPGRWDNRKAYTYGYAAFSPVGPYYDTTLGVWIGGNFWDGRASDTSFQAMGPPINPNEMNNTPVGTGNGNQYPPVLINKLKHRPYTPLIKQIYGNKVFENYTPLQIYYIWGEAIAAYEATGEVCQFSSKYDASQYGVPAPSPPGYTLTASEERGRILYGVGPNPKNDPTFGQAQCFQCHSSVANLPVQITTEGKDTFTMYCFANIGSPKNPNNPYYEMTNPYINPTGYNPLGRNYIDWGLGANPNPSLDGTKFYNKTPGDNPMYNGLFLTPTTRNSDLRPTPGFIKAYFHNGWAKSLHQVVHFYNTRNLTTVPGEVINFMSSTPYANLKGTPLWPPPEVPDPVTLTNPTGAPPLPFGATAPANTNGYGQIGNLGLTASQENDLVNFMTILSDGYTEPNPPNAMGSN